MGCLSAKIDLLNPSLKFFVNDISEKLKVTFGIVCSVEVNNRYLRVQPEDIQWITPDDEVVYIVKSNMDWEIEIN